MVVACSADKNIVSVLTVQLVVPGVAIQISHTFPSQNKGTPLLCDVSLKEVLQLGSLPFQLQLHLNIVFSAYFKDFIVIFIERSLEVNIAFSVGLPSLFINPPGIL